MLKCKVMRNICERYTKCKLRCWFALNKEDSNTQADHCKYLEEPESTHICQSQCCTMVYDRKRPIYWNCVLSLRYW